MEARRKFKYEVQRKIALSGGGTITVTIGSPSPIREQDYMILRPDAAQEMAGCMIDLANALRPPNTPEIQG